jgi:hypothetical protein
MNTAERKAREASRTIITTIESEFLLIKVE